MVYCPERSQLLLSWWPLCRKLESLMVTWANLLCSINRKKETHANTVSRKGNVDPKRKPAEFDKKADVCVVSVLFFVRGFSSFDSRISWTPLKRGCASRHALWSPCFRVFNWWNAPQSAAFFLNHPERCNTHLFHHTMSTTHCKTEITLTKDSVTVQTNSTTQNCTLGRSAFPREGSTIWLTELHG